MKLRSSRLKLINLGQKSTSKTEEKKTTIFLELMDIDHENYTELETLIKIPKNNLMKIT